jgi:hypothetical protein
MDENEEGRWKREGRKVKSEAVGADPPQITQI